MGRRQVQEDCRDKRRQVTEPAPGAEKVWSGSTEGLGRARLERLILGQAPVLLPVRSGSTGRAGPGWWAGWTLGFLGPPPIWLLGLPSRLILTPLSCLIGLNLWEILLPLCQTCNFHLPAAGLGTSLVPLALCLSDVCVVSSEQLLWTTLTPLRQIGQPPGPTSPTTASSQITQHPPAPGSGEIRLARRELRRADSSSDNCFPSKRCKSARPARPCSSPGDPGIQASGEGEQRSWGDLEAVTCLQLSDHQSIKLVCANLGLEMGVLGWLGWTRDPTESAFLS